MFLILAKWCDNSDSIFLVGSDPANKKLPNWSDIFRKLDTIADPADAQIQFAKVSREFVLLRDEETQEFKLDDPKSGGKLQKMKLTGDASVQWYQSLIESSGGKIDRDLSKEAESFDDDYDVDEDDADDFDDGIEGDGNKNDQLPF